MLVGTEREMFFWGWGDGYYGGFDVILETGWEVELPMEK
jgi:hypothetical protein